MEDLDMQETKRWCVRGVPTDVIDGFRNVAFEAGCPIAELVAEAFDLWWAESVIVLDEDAQEEEELEIDLSSENT